jgi:hypothetical protein
MLLLEQVAMQRRDFERSVLRPALTRFPELTVRAGQYAAAVRGRSATQKPVVSFCR